MWKPPWGSKRDNEIAIFITRSLPFFRGCFPNVAVVLQLVLICPASGAIVEWGFSVMNLIVNELHSSLKISTLDALIWINYQEDLSHEKCDEIIKSEKVW